MISKNEQKRLRTLHQKKYRNQYGAFIAETPKVVEDFLMEGWVPDHIIHTSQWNSPVSVDNFYTSMVSDAELQSLSRLEKAHEVIAVFKYSDAPEWKTDNGMTLLLDEVRDPGNMGTIIRLADWFGISQVWASPGCVDVWNPKVVQSTMGSLARVKVGIVDFETAIPDLQKNGTRVFAADLNGENMHTFAWPADLAIILGNEANGVDQRWITLADGAITIPRFGKSGAESLNVAMAGGILLSEYRRNQPL